MRASRLILAMSIVLPVAGISTGRAIARPDGQVAASSKVDLNTASAEELEQLPGVGAATAKKIIAGRPYKAVSELKGAGLTDATIAKITPLVEVKPAGRGKKATAHSTDGKSSAEDSPGMINLNTATAAELEQLPGIGPAKANKIIAGRPYKSVDDLKAAGLSPAEIAKVSPLVSLKSLGHSDGLAKINLNTATADELEKLPGVGPAKAKKIIAGRPYKSVEDLKVAGLTKAEIAKITPLVRVRQPISEAGPDTELDLNTATAEELEELPGIGAAYSKKIIAARPYRSVSELSRSGIPAATIAKIAPMVNVAATDSSGKEVAAQTPPRPGMVWCNTNSKIYHKKGDRWYGKTQQGEWMTEADAIKAGYRAAK